jgi:hypothetical protein
VAFLASQATDLEHGHAVNAGFDQRFFRPAAAGEVVP